MGVRVDVIHPGSPHLSFLSPSCSAITSHCLWSLGLFGTLCYPIFVAGGAGAQPSGGFGHSPIEQHGQHWSKVSLWGRAMQSSCFTFFPDWKNIGLALGTGVPTGTLLSSLEIAAMIMRIKAFGCTKYYRRGCCVLAFKRAWEQLGGEEAACTWAWALRCSELLRRG